MQDSGIPGFIKRDLIRGCQDPFRVCFQLVFTTALSLRAFRIIDAIVREGRENFGHSPSLRFLFICGHRSISALRLNFLPRHGNNPRVPLIHNIIWKFLGLGTTSGCCHGRLFPIERSSFNLEKMNKYIHIYSKYE